MVGWCIQVVQIAGGEKRVTIRGGDSVTGRETSEGRETRD